MKSFFVPKDSKRKDFKSLTVIAISLPCTLTCVNAVQQMLEEGRGGRRRESLWMEGLGFDSGAGKSKVCVKARTWGRGVGDWWELPCQHGTETNLDGFSGVGQGRRE